MFAHQVIEDLKTAPYVSDHNKDSLITYIRNAHKFHFGESNEIVNTFKKWVGKKRLFIDETEYIKLPYDILWFDYILSDPPVNIKRGILLARTDDNIFYTVCFLGTNQWNLMARTYEITIGVGVTAVGEIYDGSLFIPEDEAWEEEFKAATLSLVCASLVLLNCKNITTEIIKPPEALNKKRRKNNKQEIFDYYVLNVTTPSRQHGYRESTEPLSHNRLHLCRGHFKEYTTDHPLFGKFTGMYWWQPHVRGQNRNGIVVKDYNVNNRG